MGSVFDAKETWCQDGTHSTMETVWQQRIKPVECSMPPKPVLPQQTVHDANAVLFLLSVLLKWRVGLGCPSQDRAHAICENVQVLRGPTVLAGLPWRKCGNWTPRAQGALHVGNNSSGGSGTRFLVSTSTQGSHGPILQRLISTAMRLIGAFGQDKP